MQTGDLVERLAGVAFRVELASDESRELRAASWRFAAFARPSLAWADILSFTMESGCISRSTKKLRRRFTVSRLEKWGCSDPPYFR